MVDFDEATFLARCETTSSEAMQGCGQSYDVFQQRFSFAVNVLLRDLPEHAQPRAIEIAKEYGYATAEELEQAQREMAEEGYCTHGIDPNCCPAGCGDINFGDDFENAIDPELERQLYEELVEDAIATDLRFLHTELQREEPLICYTRIAEHAGPEPLFLRLEVTGQQLSQLFQIQEYTESRGYVPLLGAGVEVTADFSVAPSEGGTLSALTPRLEIVEAEDAKLAKTMLQFRSRMPQSDLEIVTSSWPLDEFLDRLVEAAQSETDVWLAPLINEDRLEEARAHFEPPSPAPRQGFFSRLFRPRA